MFFFPAGEPLPGKGDVLIFDKRVPKEQIMDHMPVSELAGLTYNVAPSEPTYMGVHRL